MWNFEKLHAFTLKTIPVDRGKCVFHLRVPYKDTLISGERREQMSNVTRFSPFHGRFQKFLVNAKRSPTLR